MVNSPTAVPPPAAAANDAGTLVLGTRLGELEIVRVLGASGFGVVYLATDHSLALVVAIKEYLPATLAAHDELGQVRWRSAFDGDAFERGRLAFIDEARILARCEHPSLLRVHRVWAANGTVYRLMPHYAGQNLVAVRRGMHKPPNEASLRALLDALLAALETLHDAGHLHGEVTPANILLLPDDRPLLLDFGAVRQAILGADRSALAAAGPSSPGPGAEVPTVPRGPWSDLHALAAVAEFCITGELPTVAPTTQQGFGHIPLDGAPARLSACAAELGYSATLCALLDALQFAAPIEAPGAAAACRALLRAEPVARAPGRIDPVLNPRPAAAMFPSGVLEPELTEDRFVADLNESMAAAAREAKLRESAAAMRSARAEAAAQASTRPHSTRVAVWGGTALVVLTFGAAGWMLNEHLGLDAETGKLAAHAAPGRLLGTVATVEPAARSAAATDNRPPTVPLRRTAAQPVGAGADLPRTALMPAREATPTSRERVGATMLMADNGMAQRDAPVRPSVDKLDEVGVKPRVAARGGASPREECGNRTEFALYRCMQSECAQPRWATHAQCIRLRATDEVD